MMNLATAGALERAFRKSTEVAYREAQLRFQRAEQERDRKEKIEDDAAEVTDFAMSMASIAEIEDFKVELATYDTATIEALQENEEQLGIARQNLDAILGKAFVLPDGRHVFKTEDGLRVFDEHGQELDASQIDPNEIEDWRPRWEIFDAARDRVDALEQERSDLLDYQDELDDARKRLDSGDLTQKEFDELRAKLKDDMPVAVRDKIPGMEREVDPAQEASAASKPEALDISDDMVPTSTATKIQTFGLNGLALAYR